jgi:hypothetical protein
LLQGGDEGVVGKVLSQPDISGAPCQCRYDTGRLDPPNSVVRAVGGDAGLAHLGHLFLRVASGRLEVGREIRHLEHLAQF